MALPDLTGQNIEDTYQRVLQTDGVNIYDGTGSLVSIVATGSFATTGSNIFNGNQIINGDVTINGTASISVLNVSIESASIIYSSGSNQFGDALNDTQTLYGSVIIPTGSLTVNGNISASGDLFINNGANQIRIGDNIDDNTFTDTFKIYNSGTKGFVSTYFYNSTLELKAGASGSSFVNNWSKIEIADNFASNGYIRLFTSGSERMRISNTGNVGILTPSPSASLHISGASASNLLRIDSPTSSSILVVTGSGRVGINTATPRAATELVGTLRITNITDSNRFNDLATDVNGYMTLQNLVYGTGIGSNSGWVNLFTNFINVGSGSGYFFTSTANSGTSTRDVGFSRAGINIVSVNDGAAGNTNGTLLAANIGVGISTTAPTARLQLRGSGTTSATTALLIENANTSASLIVRDDGRVGIGTISPSASLDVLGSGRFTNGLSLTGSMNITGSIIATSSATGQSALGTGLIVNNSAGSAAMNDFEVRTQLFDAIYVTSSADAISIMSSPNGKVGFFGAAPSTQSLGWSVTNYLVSKSFDANAVTLEQLADVVGSILTELKAKGLLG